MIAFRLPTGRSPRRILCLGAHADDIEIGCGGTLLKWIGENPGRIEVTWIVFSATSERAREAEKSAGLFLKGAKADLRVLRFRDGFFPAAFAEIKECFEQWKPRFSPDVIFTHYRNDRHQDHRVLSDLTWNTFRDHLILEYEVPKFDGDLGQPNVFVPLDESHCRRKIRHTLGSFASQRGRAWFTEDTLRALLRLRGVECASATRYAEAFYGRKVVIG